MSLQLPSRILLLFLLGCFPYFTSAQDYEIITPENADQLEYVAKLGRGYVTDIEFVDDETFEIRNYFGDRWQYHVHDMTTPPIFTPAKIPPINKHEMSFEYTYRLSEDRQWSIERDGIWSVASNEQVVPFEGYSGIDGHIMASNYLVIWRTNYHAEPDGQCTVDTPCSNQIVVINMFTKQTYGEVFADDVEGIHLALNGTHIAIQRTHSTDFYSLHNPNELEFAFNIPASLNYVNETGTYGIAYEYRNPHLYVWNLETRTQQLHITYKEGEYIWGVQLSDNGHSLAVVTTVELFPTGRNDSNYQDKNIGLWDTQTGQQLAIIPYFAPRIDMKFSDDGGYFVVYSQNDAFYGTEKGVFFLTLYETQTGRQIAQIDNGYWQPISDVAFSPDAQYLAITFFDGRIVLINTATGEIEFDEAGYNGYISQLNFYDGYVITSSTSDYSDWWDLDTLEHVGRDEKCLTLGIDPISEQVACLYHWSFDEAELIPFRLKDIVTNDTIEADDERLNWDWLLNTTFSPDGRQFVTQSDSINPNVWDAKTLEFIITLEGHDSNPYGVRGFQYLADGAYIGSQSQGVIWDAETFEIVARVDSVAGINDRGVYSEVGDWVAFPDQSEDTITIWRLSNLYTNPSPEPFAILSDFRSDGRILSASPDGHLLAITTWNMTTLIETDTFSIIHQYRSGGREVQFSPDGRYIIHADGICLACGADESLHIGSADMWAVPSG